MRLSNPVLQSVVYIVTFQVRGNRFEAVAMSVVFFMILH